MLGVSIQYELWLINLNLRQTLFLKMMLKEKKLDYQRSCEEYIEQKKLYETFEDMMKALIVNKPKDPIKFLIDKLQSPEST